MKIILTLILFTPVLLLTGCASIVEGTSQTVMVKTQPEMGASCQLKNRKGTWYLHQTPGTVVIHKSSFPVMITCTKGKHMGKLIQKAHMKGMVAGNAVFGGLIGTEIDSSDGAAYIYPEQMVVPMHKKSDYIDGIYFGP